MQLGKATRTCVQRTMNTPTSKWSTSSIPSPLIGQKDPQTTARIPPRACTETEAGSSTITSTHGTPTNHSTHRRAASSGMRDRSTWAKLRLALALVTRERRSGNDDEDDEMAPQASSASSDAVRTRGHGPLNGAKPHTGRGVAASNAAASREDPERSLHHIISKETQRETCAHNHFDCTSFPCRTLDFTSLDQTVRTHTHHLEGQASRTGVSKT